MLRQRFHAASWTLREDLLKLLQVDRLDEVFVKTSFLCRGTVFGAAVAAHGDKEDAGQRGHGTDLAADFKAVHARQADVEQQEFRLEVGSGGKRIRSREGGASLMTAAALQHGEAEGGVCVVIH